jgi:hypothetical protein
MLWWSYNLQASIAEHPFYWRAAAYCFFVDSSCSPSHFELPLQFVSNPGSARASWSIKTPTPNELRVWWCFSQITLRHYSCYWLRRRILGPLFKAGLPLEGTKSSTHLEKTNFSVGVLVNWRGQIVISNALQTLHTKRFSLIGEHLARGAFWIFGGRVKTTIFLFLFLKQLIIKLNLLKFGRPNKIELLITYRYLIVDHFLKICIIHASFWVI